METEMSCEQMLAEARRLAANIGYVVVPEAVQADGLVHAPPIVTATAVALQPYGFKVVPVAGDPNDSDCQVPTDLHGGEASRSSLLEALAAELERQVLEDPDGLHVDQVSDDHASTLVIDGLVEMDCVAAAAMAWFDKHGSRPAEAVPASPVAGMPTKAAEIVTLEPGWDFNPVASGLLALADALECFWNPAIDAARTSQDGTAIATAGALAEGFAAMARRLREHAKEPGNG